MAEAMTVETIVEAYWQIQGYWTKVRFPFQTNLKGWSDIDILAYNPNKKDLIVSESKVRGPKKNVFAYTKHTREAYGNIFDYDGDNYLSFLNHASIITNDGVLFDDFSRMVKSISFQLVSNYFVDDDVKEKVLTEVIKKIRKSIPESVEYNIRLDTTFDIICEIIELENKNPQGRRYGNPILDIAREINRYMHPKICYAGRERESSKKIKKLFKDRIIEALGFDE
jgi:hypothetical protein